MNTLPRFFASIALTTFAFTPALLRAQDAPPPPPDQGAPAPDQAYQGAPPPDQGPAPQDQGGDQGDDQGASFQTFYDQLGSQGQWVQTDDYGYVFQPTVSDPQWAPYTDGHWVYTDVGWTWVSDEPWGWATYHYGRWCNIDGTGWCWVPGYRWAPAWVSWRYGGGYCGWAPLPPETFVGAEYGRGGVNVGIGFHFGSDVDVNFNIGPGCYNFVRVGDFGERNYRGHYIDRNRNYTVINNTTNITNINVNRTTVNNYYGTNGAAANFRGVNAGGPNLAEINAHSREHVQTVQLTQANQAGRSTLNGNSLAVFAPRMNPTTQHTARPTRVGETVAHPTFNRGDSITKPLDVTSTVRPAAASPEAIAAAREAEAKAPAKAHIANEHTAIKSPMTTPLTSMQPVEQPHHTASATEPAVENNGGQKSTTPHTDSAFTGETQRPAAATHPQTEVTPRTDNNGSSAFTGEPQKPAQTYHPQAQANPTPTFHPQATQKPTQTFHPQTETAPGTHTQPVEKPAPTFHPQTETQSNGGQVYHQPNQSEFRPTQQPEHQPSFHPQSQGNPQPSYHPQQQVNPNPSFHPQQQQAPVVHTQAAPQPQHESAPPQHPQAAPAPQQHSAPPQGGGGQGGGNKSSGGNGSGNGNQQNH